MAQEFSISGYEYEFRIPTISPVDILAISTQIDFESFKNTRATFIFALENTEVKMGEKWFPVKTKGREVYMPQGIEKNLTLLNDLIIYFFENVLAKSFTKSNE